MGKRNRKIFIIWMLIFLLCGTSFNISKIRVQAANEKKRVLFISSYSYAWSTVQPQIEGIQNGLGRDVTLDYEFMDTKRVDDERSLELFKEGLAYRLSKVEPYDAVILGDDAALRFALTYRDELFEGIPLVFEGVNDDELAKEAAKEPMITGVMEKLSLESNIEFGLMLNPNAVRVVAILDDTLTGQAERKRYYECAEKYPELSFKEINVSMLATSSLKYALGSVAQDSILIYVVMSEDGSGKLYSDYEAIQMITENVHVPTLRMVEAGMGEGLLGGNMVSMYKSGELAAELALKMIDGMVGDEVELIMDSPNVYCVDAAVMAKYNISMSVLPKDTVIVNYTDPFMERYKDVLIPGVIIIIMLIGVIGWISINNHRRRRLMAELEESRTIMETASQHDFLTGLPNRRKFMSDLTVLIEKKIPCTVIMLDIDDFKTINDVLGHTAGDEALQQVAGRMKEIGTELMTSYRFAGDEFIAILRSEQSKIIEKTAYQFRQIFAKPFKLTGNTHKICGSIGIASYPKDADDLEQLIVCADDAMYEVKKNGKNDFAIYKKKPAESE